MMSISSFICHPQKRVSSLALGIALIAGSATLGWGQIQTFEVNGEEVRFEQRLNAQVPTDLAFRDTSGQKVPLSEYFNGKPVIFTLVYYECPMLCHLVLNGLLEGMKEIPYTAGEDFQVVTISFNPKETHVLAEAKKKNYLEAYDRPGAEEGWHFLVGEEDDIQTLCDAMGFGFKWDPRAEEYAHGSGIFITTGDGVISRVLPGIVYEPRDLRLSLVEASRKQIGTIVDKLSLLCFQFNHVTGQYSFFIMNIIRIACGVTIVAMAWLIVSGLKRERARTGVKPEATA
jgi:protein SCO1/2